MTSRVDQADIERGLREIGLREGHPVAAGQYKDILTAVADLDGHVLLLGCRNRNNASIHSAQAATFLAVEGIPRAKREFLRSLPKRPEDFDQLDEPLIEAGAMRVGGSETPRSDGCGPAICSTLSGRSMRAGIATPTRLALAPRTFRALHLLPPDTTPSSTI